MVLLRELSCHESRKPVFGNWRNLVMRSYSYTSNTYIFYTVLKKKTSKCIFLFVFLSHPYLPLFVFFFTPGYSFLTPRYSVSGEKRGISGIKRDNKNFWGKKGVKRMVKHLFFKAAGVNDFFSKHLCWKNYSSLLIWFN